ncbi:MAG TPA: peptide chain release factor N(5)-glutamine methyltransferase [Gemmatimonadaceae bacterium]|nr:peptide chain release factor N(5)-glutamine methyltransferase [Gemmatimonadaceae bacterium]
MRDGQMTPVMESTTVGALVGELAQLLAGTRVTEPAREARDIIAALRDAPRFWPTVNAHAVVSAEERRAARDAASRRAAGAPFAYAVGTAAFRRLTLSVDERVLIPRPETELIIDLALALTDGLPGGTAIDIGTGSGAIALALATEGSFERVLAGDISSDAIAVATANAQRLSPDDRARLEFRVGSLFAPFTGERARLVVSNPPYIADSEAAELPDVVRSWEPAVALFSGPDGMTAIRRIIRDARDVLEPGGWLLLEVDSRRASWVMEAFSLYDSYADIGVRLDLAGRERFVFARLRETGKQ